MTGKYHSFAAAILIFISSACSNIIPAPPSSPQYFDFGPVTRLDVPGLQRYNLRSSTVTSASWMEQNAIQYRQLFNQPFAWRRYAAHAWVAPPAELLARRINYLLFNEHDTVDGKMPSPPLYLQLVLDSFEQIYESPTNAYVQARILATVVDEKNNPVMRREFAGRRSARPDVHGAIESLPVLADELIVELVSWLSSLPEPE